jgi:hypothetical protein
MPVSKKHYSFGSAREAADLFEVSERLVRDRVAKGIWPSYCIGGRRVFDLDELVPLVKAGSSISRSEGVACP